MEAPVSYETLLPLYKTWQCHIPGGHNLVKQ